MGGPSSPEADDFRTRAGDRLKEARIQVPVYPNSGDGPFLVAILVAFVFLGLILLVKTLGGRFYRRELARQLDQLKSLAGAIERAQSEAMKLDVPVLFHLDDVSRHLSSQLVVMPGNGELLFEPIRFAPGTGSIEPSRIEVCDPESGWGGQIRIDSSGLVVLTREWEYGAYSIQHTRPFPLAIDEGSRERQDSSYTLASQLESAG